MSESVTLESVLPGRRRGRPRLRINAKRVHYNLEADVTRIIGREAQVRKIPQSDYVAMAVKAFASKQNPALQ